MPWKPWIATRDPITQYRSQHNDKSGGYNTIEETASYVGLKK